jgi:hypothetical protein
MAQKPLPTTNCFQDELQLRFMSLTLSTPLGKREEKVKLAKTALY